MVLIFNLNAQDQFTKLPILKASSTSWVTYCIKYKFWHCFACNYYVVDLNRVLLMLFIQVCMQTWVGGCVGSTSCSSILERLLCAWPLSLLTLNWGRHPPTSLNWVGIPSLLSFFTAEKDVSVSFYLLLNVAIVTACPHRVATDTVLFA